MVIFKSGNFEGRRRERSGIHYCCQIFFQWSSVCIKVWHISVGREVLVKCNFAYGCYCHIQNTYTVFQLQRIHSSTVIYLNRNLNKGFNLHSVVLKVVV